ncbi:hypothetical protein CEUSTIGMA_g13391.t1 [Chlamydomonas eustigma]|uniref:Chlorophyll a-b binding protein, chloroplastic n=1 Tax=Chlamydomonas eustigma TaxID=1157962 RepID=A0A250XSE1_9CHLO|nr:hypothetical protein CEUSTIGMA_g13391.t1 [Chlamydomonas eustigma]|eukprot:GAX85975.1 hypothetical protein CEUSTIGMA_g13391.t1 [Chlamydomonas eustigma]
MSFALMSKPAAGVSGRSSRSCRSVTVKAQVSARSWINNWKEKKAAASNRASWFPGTPLPSHLDGTLPGDFGFDPLNLGVEPFKLQWYVQAELQNGRWAMLGVAGILFQELLGDLNVGGPAAEVPWFDQKTFQYYAPPSTLFIVMMFLFSWVEINRYQDMRNPGSVNQDPIFKNNKIVNNSPGYPGFDPLSFSKARKIFFTFKDSV